jgi:carbonic anhydrase
MPDAFEHILAANATFAASYTLTDLAPQPRRKIAIVACMDARIDPPRALGLEPGDAHILRNAGGRVAEAFRSLAISQQMLGTEAVAIIHHTRCGLIAPDDDAIRERLRMNLGVEAAMDFLTFPDLEQSVRDDIALYRAWPIVRQDIPVRGFVYDVDSGRLREVV